MEVNTVMVVGAGQMGGGIAQVMAQAGIRTFLHDSEPSMLEKARKIIERNLNRSVEKGRISREDEEKTLGLLSASKTLDDAAWCDVVVEAIIENKDIKFKLFSDLDKICPEKTILASNTSSVPITEIGAATNRPDKVIGMHFMNPVPLIKLVEIIRGLATTDEVCRVISDLSHKLGKTSVEVRDVPGFVSNRVLQTMINEAIYCVYEGVASPEDIDAVMTLGINHPMGPLALADFIGLDTVLYIMEVMYSGYCDSRYRPCPLLKQYVAAGWLGRKSGKGFYSYEK